MSTVKRSVALVTMILRPAIKKCLQQTRNNCKLLYIVDSAQSGMRKITNDVILGKKKEQKVIK